MESRLRDWILRSLKSRHTDRVERAVMVCASCFERFSGQTNLVHPEIERENVTRADVAVLKRALLKVAKAEPMGVGATAVWALGKLHDPSLKEQFDAVLREQVAAAEDACGAAYQTMVALMNLKIGVGAPRTSYSAMEYEANLRDVRDYLAGLAGHARGESKRNR